MKIFLPFLFGLLIGMTGMTAILANNNKNDLLLGSSTTGSTWFLNASSQIQAATTGWGLRVPFLANCDTIDTNANGVFACGTDATGSGGGITSLNGLTAGTQTFASSSSGTDFNITSSGSVHTFRVPSASNVNRGLLTAANWTSFNAKVASSAIDTSAELISLVTNETGTNRLVFSNAPAFSGTATFSSLTSTSTATFATTTQSARLTLSGSTANIALGSNWLSGDGGDEGIFVSSTGNVGIGITSPSKKLQVNGGVQIGDASVTSIDLRLTRTSSAVAADANYFVASANSPVQSWIEGGYLTGERAGTITAANSGYPYYEEWMGNGGSTVKNFGFINKTSGTFINTDILNVLTLTRVGRVGIGTTSPTQELSVTGDLIVTGRIYDSAASAGTNGMVLKSTGSGFTWVATSTLGITGSGGSSAISTSTAVSAGNLAYWTSNKALSQVATGTLTETVTGLALSATRGLVGGSSILSLDAGRVIPLSASTTNWNGFYDVPSTRITAGTGIDWSSNTLNGVYTAGDALTLTGEDFDFDGGISPAGALGGTWASPTVDDDGHAHTASTISGLGTADISGLDISDDTNLAVTSPMVLTGDTLSILADGIGDTQLAFNTGQTLTTVGTPTFATLDTGFGANELYDMNQHVQTTDRVTFVHSTTTSAAISSMTSALLQTGSTGIVSEYAGTSCTNQFPRSLSVLGIATCASVAIASDVSGLASGIATWLTTPSSANLATAVTDETGSGVLVFGTAPTLASTTLNSRTRITNASTTNTSIGGTLSFNSVVGSTWASFCVAITGGSGLCDGVDGGGAGATGLATSSPVSASNLLYYASNGTAKGVATTTLAGNSQVAISNSPVVLGASGAVLSVVGDSIGDAQLAFDTGQALTTTAAVTHATLDTGFGANELYDMNQHVQTTDRVTFVHSTTTSAAITGLTSALVQTGASGITAEYAGSGTCTNQFVTVLSALGIGTCASVTSAAITDNEILEGDLSADNTPGDTDYLQYDSTGTNFIWRTLADVAADLEASLESGLDTLSSLVTVTISTTLSIPFGATCDSNADGEICQDTTDNQFLVDGSAIPTTNLPLWQTTVASTSIAYINAGLLKVPTQLDGFTITAIRCSVQGGTSKIIAIEDEDTNSSEDITCGTTVTSDDGTITNAEYTAAEEIYIDFGATSGVVDYVSISVFGNWTRE